MLLSLAEDAVVVGPEITGDRPGTELPGESVPVVAGELSVLLSAGRSTMLDADFTRRIATIGVYEFDADSFLGALRAAGVEQLLDVRQRRGVRGAQYAWANSRRLQAQLSDAGIAYRHHPELAPTTELRNLQYEEDDRQGVGKRSRVHLAPEYIARYTREVLDRAPLERLVEQLPAQGIGALMCVEASAQACHRSLVAERLAHRFGFEIVHLEGG